MPLISSENFMMRLRIRVVRRSTTPLIDSEVFRERLYDRSIGNEEDTEDVRWNSGCWIRYRLVADLIREMEEEANGSKEY